MRTLLRKIWSDAEGLDVAEYAVMVGALLVLIFGLLRAL
jgi:Flp pilus assembly pilin Flp